MAACPHRIRARRGELDGVAVGRTGGDGLGGDEQVNIRERFEIGGAGVAALTGFEQPELYPTNEIGWVLLI